MTGAAIATGSGKSRGREDWANEPFLFEIPKKFYFWVILIAGFIVMQFVHNGVDNYSYAGVATLGVIVAGSIMIQGLTGVPVPRYIWANSRRFIIAVVVYAVIGTGYVGSRWFVETAQWKSAYTMLLKEFQAKHGVANIDPLQKEWTDHYTKAIGPQPSALAPHTQARSWKWFIAWPWSVCQWLLGDLLNALIDWMKHFLTNMMLAIERYNFRGLPGLSR